MRSTFVTMAAVLIVGIATPALAARHVNPSPAAGAAKHQNSPPSYDTCAALSRQRGSLPGEGNSGNSDAMYNGFVRQCLDGKIPTDRS